MNRLLGLTMGAAALSLSVLVAAPTAEKQKLDKVDLSQMRDGETRTLGKGDHTVTAVRKGDVITLTLNDGEGGKRTLKCTVGKDSCYAMTSSDAGKSQIIVLNKSGKADKGEPVVVHAGDGEEGAFVFATADGDEGDTFVVKSFGDGMSWVTSEEGESLPGMKVIRVHGDGGAVLECPEGDAMLTLKKGEEASGPYFCPKHNLKMEKSKGHSFVKHIEVNVDSKDKDEE
jgi:hypothetical protein